jgi:TetR/AcrR family transcriptional regulator
MARITRKKRAGAARAVNGRDAEVSQAKLLAAATEEFARHGLLGARVDTIASNAGVNKQLIYYHFNNKEALYVAVLERVYTDIRERERELELDHLPPLQAMDKLVSFTFDYVTEHPNFVSLLMDENVHRGVHLRKSSELKRLRSPFVGFIAETLKRGERVGAFRRGLDPMQFYISLAGICFFYHANIHTLSALFDRALATPAELKQRRAHVVDFVRHYLRP